MKVSIIIPHYNRPKLLLEAIDSVLNQTYQDWELIVVDDGSGHPITIPTDKRIKLLNIPHNGKPGYVRNRGVEISSGLWIAFLDSDDIWKPEKLETQIEYINQNPQYNIVHTKEVWNRSGKIISQKSQKHKREGYIFEDALIKCIIGPSTVILSRSLWDEVGGFNEDMEIAEDYELWLRITNNNNVGYVDQPLTIKRAGDWDQLSEKYGHIEKFRIDGLAKLVVGGFYKEKNRMELALKELIRKCGIFRNGAIKRNLNNEIALIDNLLNQLSN